MVNGGGVGYFISQVIGEGVDRNYSLIHKELVIGESESITAWAMSFHLFVKFCLSPVISTLCNKSVIPIPIQV